MSQPCSSWRLVHHSGLLETTVQRGKRSMPSFVCGAQPCDSCCGVGSLHAFVPDRRPRLSAQLNVAPWWTATGPALGGDGTVRSAHSLWWSVRRHAASGRFMSLTPRVDVTNGLCTCGSHLNNHNADIEGSSGFNLSQNRRMFSRGFSVVAAETALFEGHMYIITHILNT